MVEPLDILIENHLTPVSRESLNEQIVSQIKALIYSKGIGVGKKLPSERELAQHFKVSRAIVREALKSLKQSGLVDIRTGARGGSFVVAEHHIPLFQVSYDLFSAGELTLSNFYEARNAIECSTVRLAASKATSEDIGRLRVINNMLVNEQTDPAKLGEYNTAFHVAIAEMSRNPLMHLIVQSVMSLLGALFTGWDHVRTRKSMNAMYKRHQAIIEAMEKHDINRCEELMSEDTSYTERLAVSRSGAVPNKSNQ